MGTKNHINERIVLAQGKGGHVLGDGAKAVANTEVDVQALDADLYVFSGHKI